MKLYLLTVIGNIELDSYDSMLIRAKCENDARKLANIEHSGEGNIWEDPQETECEIVTNFGKEEIIISSYNAG